MKTSRERAIHSEQLFSNVGSGPPFEIYHLGKLGHALDVPVIVLIAIGNE